MKEQPSPITPHFRSACGVRGVYYQVTLSTAVEPREASCSEHHWLLVLVAGTKKCYHHLDRLTGIPTSTTLSFLTPSLPLFPSLFSVLSLPTIFLLQVLFMIIISVFMFYLSTIIFRTLFKLLSAFLSYLNFLKCAKIFVFLCRNIIIKNEL